MLKINEIFYSIQGESSLAGWPTVFVRTTACNLRCTYCDTKYSYFEGDKMSFDQILDKIKSFAAPGEGNHVCVTGGEPLAQKGTLELMKTLCDMGYVVSLETNGHYSVADVDPRVIKVVDVKTPDSGEGDSFNFENLKHLKKEDQLKFVLCSSRDYEWAKEMLKVKRLHELCQVFFSPSFEELSVKDMAEKILEDKLPVRLQIQLHKVIWNPHQRGV